MMRFEDMTERTVRDIVASIIRQAAQDWDSMTVAELRGRKTASDRYAYIDFDEIRNFFKSEWGYELCQLVGLDSLQYLTALEERRQKAKLIGKMPRRIRSSNE